MTTEEANTTTKALSIEERRAAFASLSTRRRVTGRHFWLATLVVASLCGLGALAGVFLPDGGGPSAAHQRQTADKPPKGGNVRAASGIAAFMGLTRLAETPAPSVHLVDQDGTAVSLAAMRGKVIVLTFLDDRCGALCPVVAEELHGAATDLGRERAEVDFVGVNVDVARRSPADLLAYSSDYGLASISSWFFLTGDSAQLSAAWRAYDISVEPGPRGTVTYTSAIYFITPAGDEAYEVTPYANELANGTGTLPASSIRRWAEGIATYARTLIAAGHAK